MLKISIAMYSHIFGTLHKARQIEAMMHKIKELNLSYTIYGLRGKQKILDINIHETKFPKYCVGIYKRVTRHFKNMDYISYLVGEEMFYYRYLNLFKKDDSTIAILKPRPYKLVKLFKSMGKIVYLMPGEMYPLFTKDTLLESTENDVNLKKNLFLNEKAINDCIKSIELADHIICMTSSVRKSYIDYGVNADKLITIPLGYDSKLFKKSKQYYDIKKELVFITTASHSILKGTHKLIELWSERKIKSKLIIIGDIRTDLNKYLFNIKLSDSVQFLGSVKQKELEALYRKYNTVGISFSLSEGYGRAVSEFLALSIPVMVLKNSDLDFVENGIHGFTYDFWDINKLYSDILDIQNNIKKYNEMVDQIFDGFNCIIYEFGEKIIEIIMENLSNDDI